MKLHCVTFLFINFNNNSNSSSNKLIVTNVEQHCKTDEWECLTADAAR